MKKVLTLIAVMATSNIYAQNVQDYFYAPNNTTILYQIYQDYNGEYVSTAEHTISNKYESIQGQKFLFSTHSIVALGSYGSTYYIQNYYLIEDNIAMLFAQTKMAGNSSVDYEVNTAVFKLPSGEKELAWNNVYGKYISKIVDLPTKNKTNISSVRIEKYNNSGEINEIEYWCKGWGLSLVLNKYGSILMVNLKLFDLKLLENSSQVLYYKGKEREQKINKEFKLHDLSIKVEDASLVDFLDSLRRVVSEKDILKINNFLGGNLLYLYKLNPQFADNRNEYYARELHNNNSEVWNEIEKSLNIGCYQSYNEYTKQNEFIFPWYEAGLEKFIGEWDSKSGMQINRIVDIHDAYIVLGDNVSVRSRPSTSSNIIATLSWVVVKSDNENRESIENNDWVKIL
ncbi:MAG: hypothetical protein Q8T08_07390 [Ignavibacteria bacterium]|nr:hypothetical protein [Ignavibacteria bacterium]